MDVYCIIHLKLRILSLKVQYFMNFTDFLLPSRISFPSNMPLIVPASPKEM